MVTLSVVFGERKGSAAQPKCFRGVIELPKATAKKKSVIWGLLAFYRPSKLGAPLIAVHKWMP